MKDDCNTKRGALCAVITGASGAIGSAITEELAARGYACVAAYNSSCAGAEDVVARIAKAGGEACVFKCDVASRTQTDEMLNFALSRYGKIDVLINNAGIASFGLLSDMSESEIDKVLAVNLRGVVNCCAGAEKIMFWQGSGRIINVSSIWGQTGGSCEAVYSAAKGGVIALTKALAKECARMGITVNCVAPGIIDTPMNNTLSDEDVASFLQEVPLGRLGTPREVARAVAFLASEDATYITGQVLGVNGGAVI